MPCENHVVGNGKRIPPMAMLPCAAPTIDVSGIRKVGSSPICEGLHCICSPSLRERERVWRPRGSVNNQLHCTLSLWERAGVRAAAMDMTRPSSAQAEALTLTLSQREREPELCPRRSAKNQELRGRLQTVRSGGESGRGTFVPCGANVELM